jgi:hypothetical protein
MMAMSDHIVSTNFRWTENPHSVVHWASCSTCDWREETEKAEQALMAALHHIRKERCEATRHPSDCECIDCWEKYELGLNRSGTG